MGTRGLWSILMNGMYYPYYIHWDADMFAELAKMIPLDPAERREWIAVTTQDYVKLEKSFAWDISPDDDFESTLFPENSTAENLALVPSYARPDIKNNLEHVFVIDLDNERLIFDHEYYPMDKLPTLPKNWNSGADSDTNLEAPSTATNVPPYRQHITSTEFELKYEELQIEIMPIYDKTAPGTKKLVSDMKNAFELIFEIYESQIIQAKDILTPGDHLFREICFMFLSIASCSPDRVRLLGISGQGLDTLMLSALTRYHYGILKEMDGSKKVAVQFLSNYREIDHGPGSAPKETSYWIGPMLVRLERDLEWNEIPAIYSAVKEGKSHKQDFKAIIFSIQHFILLDVTREKVLRSERYNLYEEVTIKTARPWGRQNPAQNNHFETLAQFFLDARTTEVTPSDLLLDRSLRLVRSNNILQQTHGINHLYETADEKRPHCFLLIQAMETNATSSIITVPVPWSYDRDQSRTSKLDYYDDSDPGEINLMLSDSMIIATNRVVDGLKDQLNIQTDRTGFQWDLVPAHEESATAITSHPNAIAVLFTAVLFFPLGIFGSSQYEIYPRELSENNISNISRQWLNSYVQIGSRWVERKGRYSAYCVGIFWSSSEDTQEGWSRAEADGIKQGQQEYFLEAKELWIEGDDTDLELIIFIAIGGKIKAFHPLRHPRIPAAKDISPNLDMEKLKKNRSEGLWRDMGIEIGQMQVDLEFIEITSKNKSPLDLFQTADRPAIENLFREIQQLAQGRGDQADCLLDIPKCYLGDI